MALWHWSGSKLLEPKDFWDQRRLRQFVPLSICPNIPLLRTPRISKIRCKIIIPGILICHRHLSGWSQTAGCALWKHISTRTKRHPEIPYQKSRRCYKGNHGWYISMIISIIWYIFMPNDGFWESETRIEDVGGLGPHIQHHINTSCYILNKCARIEVL